MASNCTRATSQSRRARQGLPVGATASRRPSICTVPSRLRWRRPVGDHGAAEGAPRAGWCCGAASAATPASRSRRPQLPARRMRRGGGRATPGSSRSVAGEGAPSRLRVDAVQAQRRAPSICARAEVSCTGSASPGTAMAATGQRQASAPGGLPDRCAMVVQFAAPLAAVNCPEQGTAARAPVRAQQLHLHGVVDRPGRASAVRCVVFDSASSFSPPPHHCGRKTGVSVSRMM